MPLLAQLTSVFREQISISLSLSLGRSSRVVTQGTSLDQNLGRLRTSLKRASRLAAVSINDHGAVCDVCVLGIAVLLTLFGHVLMFRNDSYERRR